MRIRATAIPFATTLMASAIYSQLALAQGGTLEEIIVTAEKRASTLQDTPIAVSAFTGDELARGLINNAMDIQMSVPNMLMSKGNFTTASVSIRGIGNNAIGSAADSGTGIHFNGVYLNNGRIFETEFFDTERVEVLRGPQGTLYGRNTTAGVINVLPNRPDDEFGGDIKISVGNYNAYKVTGSLNLPINDNWSQRFAGFYSKRDGFVDNIYTGNDIDDRDIFAFRSSTQWRGDSTDATLVINYMEEDDSRMRGSNQQCLKDPEGIIGCLPTGLADEGTNSHATVTGWLLGFLGAFPYDDFASSIKPSDPRKQNLDFEPIYEVKDTIVSLEINHEMGDLTLTSLTGYHNSEFDARNDYDFTVASEVWPYEVTTNLGADGSFTAARAFSSDRSSTDPEQWSQEFRLASDFSGDWNFLLGAFWLTYENENHYIVNSAALEAFGANPPSFFYPEPMPPEVRIFDNNTRSFELDTKAIFGEVYWQASDKLSLTLGLRYTEEEKRSLQRSVYLTFLDLPWEENNGYSKFGGEWEEVTGKFNINYDLNDEIMLYATLARSYKSGGFNPISTESTLLDPETGGNPSLANFEPEFINSIELGAKTRLLDNTLQANLTYFFYDFEDLQVAKITQQTALNENIESSTIQGMEAELIWAPDEHWRFSADISWLDTEIDKFESIDPANINKLGTTENIITSPNANVYIGPGCAGGVPSCDGLPYDLSGNSLTNAPELSYNLGISYRWPLDNGMELTLGTNYYWQDTFYSRVFNAPNDEIDEWDVWNASMHLRSADDIWYAEAWVRNIQDDDHVTGQFLGDQNVGLATNQFLLEPRTYGLTVGYNF
ncbi:MAG: TonB-dependent receptor [Halieaceae bacterium]|jgi:iron complex outermembrane recepter protein|nr:TonB-dependent receptor [Halieaceae bacterium]